MKKWLLPVAGFLLVGCGTLRADLPDAKAVSQPAKQALQTRKNNWKTKQKAPSFPQSLGGVLQSDEWIIYQDKEQEEFKGHVSYDNGVYVLRAEYVRSDRKKESVYAQGNVYLKQHEPQGPVYEVHADEGNYFYKTGKGLLKSTSKKPVELQLTEPAQTVTATARQVAFDTNAQIFTLTGKVLATRTTPEGIQTLQADKVIFKQTENYLYLDGNAKLADQARTLQADTIIYNGAANEARALGARPLLTGSAEQGTFAIIADNVSSDAQGNVVKLDGRVQGWLVSPELNNNKLNSKF